MLSFRPLLLMLFPCALAASPKNPDLACQIKMAPTNLEKHALLKETNEKWVFDFTSDSNYTFRPGSVINANAYSSLMMVGTGMTMAVLNLGPCSMLPPHLHPRGTNVVTAVHGTTRTWMWNENGAEAVSTTLMPGMVTVFPAGSLHGMINIGCSNAQLISALNSEDAGTLNILNGASLISDDLLQAAFQGALGHDVWTNLKSKIQPVGTGAQWGPKACYKACGLAYPDSSEDVWTFDDGGKMWDGANGTQEGYFDIDKGRAKDGVELPYSD